MSNDNQIITADDGIDPYAQLMPTDLNLAKYTEEDADAVTSNGFLPRLQVMGSNTEAVKEGRCAMGVHALVYTKDKFTELGKEVPFYSITFRTKALRLPSEGNPISYFDRNSTEFKKVVADSATPNSGCMFGPEFLIWVPSAQSFATYFFGNPTMRRAAPALLTLMKADDGSFRPRAALSKINFIKGNNGFSWHGALIHPYTTPLPPPPDDFSILVKEESDKFLNPPQSLVESVELPKEGARVR